MKKTNTYIVPRIKVRAIVMEGELLAAFSGQLEVQKYRKDDGTWNYGITDADDVGAKSGNTSDGWDDWEED